MSFVKVDIILHGKLASESTLKSFAISVSKPITLASLKTEVDRCVSQRRPIIRGTTTTIPTDFYIQILNMFSVATDYSYVGHLSDKSLDSLAYSNNNTLKINVFGAHDSDHNPKFNYSKDNPHKRPPSATPWPIPSPKTLKVETQLLIQPQLGSTSIPIVEKFTFPVHLTTDECIRNLRKDFKTRFTCRKGSAAFGAEQTSINFTAPHSTRQVAEEPQTLLSGSSKVRFAETVGKCVQHGEPLKVMVHFRKSTPPQGVKAEQKVGGEIRKVGKSEIIKGNGEGNGTGTGGAIQTSSSTASGNVSSTLAELAKVADQLHTTSESMARTIKTSSFSETTLTAKDRIPPFKFKGPLAQEAIPKSDAQAPVFTFKGSQTKASVVEKEEVKKEVAEIDAQAAVEGTGTAVKTSTIEPNLAQSVLDLTSTLTLTNDFLANFTKSMAQTFGDEPGLGLGIKREAASTSTPVSVNSEAGSEKESEAIRAKEVKSNASEKVQHDATCDGCNKSINGIRYKCEFAT